MANEESLPALMVLPELSWPIQRSSLRSAYGVTLRAALRKLVDEKTAGQGCRRLDIALLTFNPTGVDPSLPRSFPFPSVQNRLEEYYRLVCIAATEESVNLDYPGGIDVRVFFLWSAQEEAAENSIQKQAYAGPQVSIQTFAASKRSYSIIYAAEGEVGGRALEKLTAAFQSSNKLVPQIERLPCGTAISLNAAKPTEKSENKFRHYSVAVGGTFDHLHIGHKLLLSATIFVAEPTDTDQSSNPPRLITVGITGDELLVNKKYASQVESWADRQAATAAFVESILVFHPNVDSIRTVTHIDEPGPNGKVVRVSYDNQVTINYTQISDPFGPTITDEGISALVISKETRAGGKAVNDKRTEKGWKGLEVFEVDVLDAAPGDGDEGDERAAKKEKETFESKISSTEIRRRLEESKKA